MTITLKPNTLERLREKEAQDGCDLAEAVAGIQRGLDDFAAGRYSSARDVFSKIGAKHGILTDGTEDNHS